MEWFPIYNAGKLCSIEPTYQLTSINLIISIATFTTGMDITSLIVFLDKPQFLNYFGVPNALEQGLLVGSNPMGALLGCILYAILVARMGRVTMFRFGTLLWIVGSIIGITSVALWMVVLSRLIKGLTVGMFSILVVAYASEVFPKRGKGKAMAFTHLTHTASIVVIYYASVWSTVLKSHYSFKLVWGVEIIPSLIFLIFSIWLPESPQWLTVHGNYSKAEAVQNKIAETYKPNNKSLVIPKLNKIDLATLYGDGINNFRYIDLFRRNCWRQTLMGFSLQMLVQVSGVNFLMFYIIYICDMLGLEGKAKTFSASVPYFINMILSSLPITYLDKVGRRDITAAGSFPLCLIMIAIGIFMAIDGHEVEPEVQNLGVNWVVNAHGGPIILGLCFLFISIFALTLSCGPWIYTNELLPTRAKPKGFALCMLTGWTVNFILTLLGPLMILHLKWATFVLFGAMTFVISVFVVALFPETKDLDNDVIDNLYGNYNQKEKNSCSKLEKASSYPATPKTSTEPFGPIIMNEFDDSSNELKST
ncbi:hypothetical protein Kpol_1023p17 [Vanderwaltozyma polyspora DSM 70294]|uniref:Major facilitator superfamily (MFS) profile domain-containing protein n=1 Tax=Vanderwaltozyma polyspora (strain ATCC 22028 / DSM 70294 / BCRC 21397 / CBS 2163 / NBRC 10782 / NRRL Y-8283 / UCD 57-17) TaxID=436907 RepID=A7TFP0_VANPO|nr:uncharacterized protein Kpol_1023p17 [Vanderwaltozyma polyspora DSM 70294]EDO18848.1 hypothetical protein Kpol_1023p17 [Vanderwaltozyma polyspora DSM 70294]